jgi:hypothetical protein
MQLPMLFSSLTCVLSLLSSKLRPRERDREVITFYEEDPAAPSMLDKVLSLLALLVPKYKY